MSTISDYFQQAELSLIGGTEGDHPYGMDGKDAYQFQIGGGNDATMTENRCHHHDYLRWAA